MTRHEPCTERTHPEGCITGTLVHDAAALQDALHQLGRDLRRGLLRVWCRLTSHQPVTMTVGSQVTGGGQMEVCLRCRTRLSVTEWDRRQ